MRREGVRDRTSGDRRRWQRVELSVPVQVNRGAAGEEGGASPPEMGQTVNFSAGGIYAITSGGSLSMSEALLTVSIVIPWEARRMVPFSRIAGSCRVVRVDGLSTADAGKRQGLALAFCGDDVIMLGTTHTPL